MTKKCFIKGVALFLATFANVKIKDETQELWYELLKDLSDEQFLYAVKKICLEVREFYPTTNFIALIRDQFKIDMEEEALFAWETVTKTMTEVGSYRSVKFDNPIIHSVIQIMAISWEEFCQIPLDKWLQKEFINNYKIMASKDSHPEYLKGVFEIENFKNKFFEHIKPPKLIKTHKVRKMIQNSKVMELD